MIGIKWEIGNVENLKKMANHVWTARFSPLKIQGILRMKISGINIWYSQYNVHIRINDFFSYFSGQSQVILIPRTGWRFYYIERISIGDRIFTIRRILMKEYANGDGTRALGITSRGERKLESRKKNAKSAARGEIAIESGDEKLPQRQEETRVF